MKVWIVTINEPVFYGWLYLNIIKRKPENIAGIILIRPDNNCNLRSFINECYYRLRFWGIRGALYAFYLLCKSFLTNSGNLSLAAKNANIPFYKCKNLSSAKSILRENKVDIVLASVNNLVDVDTLQSASYGWINTHCGPLPKYAGLDAPFWCLFNNEPMFAVTLHYMDTHFDTGPIINQKFIKNKGQSYFDLVKSLFKEALILHCIFLEDFKPSCEDALKQNHLISTYYNRPSIKDGIQFRKNGGRFV